MKRLGILLIVACAGCALPSGEPGAELERWRARAERVTITRDDWGVPHVHGPTDADAVFALMYAQAEDDFHRIEVNLLRAQGRLAEAWGERELWGDLRMRLFVDADDMRQRYASAPSWLRELMDAWADGLNFFLHTHPGVRPMVLERFEPWMALTFSEGSIGGDIERVSLERLAAFYAAGPEGPEVTEAAAPIVAGTGLDAAARFALAAEDAFALAGSNGIAVGPSRTRDGHALLLINPHTSFYFRHEAQITSEQGLNAYGALTWGQFFVYQGFNDRAGWMHTSSSVDNIDEFLEEVVATPEGLRYRIGDELRPVASRSVAITVTTESGPIVREFTVYRTHHGPIVRELDGRWVAAALMEEPVQALIQSYSRTKVRNLDELVEVMGLHTNSSNNTVFADAEGHIAYLHANFVPIRDPRFDYRRPVDGSDPATEWRGVHSFADSPNVLDPATGWVYCTNNWPYSAAGPDSPRREDYPPYMDRGRENPRGVHAMRLLEASRDLTLEGLMDIAYDPQLPGFEGLIPAVLRAVDEGAASAAQRARLEGPVEVLRSWDLRWGVDSVATTVAVFLGDELVETHRDAARDAELDVYDFISTGLSPRQLVAGLEAAVARLEADLGTWRTPWGELNRLQRLSGDLEPTFDDDAPSTPVGFTSSRWGSLAAFATSRPPGLKRLYGVGGNSFVAVVEFGERVRARAVTVGGVSGDPASLHFDDQLERYAAGDLREVYFHPDELEGHVERVYHPGE